MTGPESVRKCVGTGQHDWRLVDPAEPPPRRMVCTKCGKHAPAEPSDDDYEQYKESGR